MTMNIPDDWKTSDIPQDDPIYTEYTWCDGCRPNIENMAFYVRELENAQVVAKQALEAVARVNEKLERDNIALTKENVDLKKRMEEQRNLEGKMADIDSQVGRFAAREKLIH